MFIKSNKNYPEKVQVGKRGFLLPIIRRHQAQAGGQQVLLTAGAGQAGGHPPLPVGRLRRRLHQEGAQVRPRLRKPGRVKFVTASWRSREENRVTFSDQR